MPLSGEKLVISKVQVHLQSTTIQRETAEHWLIKASDRRILKMRDLRKTYWRERIQVRK